MNTVSELFLGCQRNSSHWIELFEIGTSKVCLLPTKTAINSVVMEPERYTLFLTSITITDATLHARSIVKLVLHDVDEQLITASLGFL